MKKIILFLLITIPIFSFAQNERATWDYPIKPGSEEWKAFENTYQKIESCQIPYEVLKSISTANLIQLCLKYPLFPDLFFSNYLQSSFNRMIEQFNGFKELVKREDAGIILLELYKKMEPTGIDNSWEPQRKGFYTFDFVKIELLLANDDILVNMTPTALEDLSLRSKYVYKGKEKIISEYGYNFGLASTALVLGKIANKKAKLDYKSDYDKKKIELFLKTGTITGKGILEFLYQNATN